MKRHEIAVILKRHTGAKTEIARRAKVSASAVSVWLAGGTNANVAAHAEKYVLELLGRELDAQQLARKIAGQLAEVEAKLMAGKLDDPTVQLVMEKLVDGAIETEGFVDGKPVARKVVDQIRKASDGSQEG